MRFPKPCRLLGATAWLKAVGAVGRYSSAPVNGFMRVLLNVPVNGSKNFVCLWTSKGTPGGAVSSSAKSIGSIVTTSVPASVVTG